MPPCVAQVQFFEGLEVLDGTAGVHMPKTPEGRPLGEAYVEFASEAEQQEALQRNRNKLGSRYIELFVSSKAEMHQARASHAGTVRHTRWGRCPAAQCSALSSPLAWVLVAAQAERWPSWDAENGTGPAGPAAAAQAPAAGQRVCGNGRGPRARHGRAHAAAAVCWRQHHRRRRARAWQRVRQPLENFGSEFPECGVPFAKPQGARQMVLSCTDSAPDNRCGRPSGYAAATWTTAIHEAVTLEEPCCCWSFSAAGAFLLLEVHLRTCLASPRLAARASLRCGPPSATRRSVGHCKRHGGTSQATCITS